MQGASLISVKKDQGGPVWPTKAILRFMLGLLDGRSDGAHD